VSTLSRAELRLILITGIIAGTIDIGAACVINAVGPVLILKAIASGILGRASFRGGASVAALGLALQWLMASLIAAIYFVAARNVAVLRRNWIVSGFAYGVVVFLVMNYVVLPLSAVGHSPAFTLNRFVGNLLAMFLFGLIVAFAARRSPRSS
jgi:hypothetical protein